MPWAYSTPLGYAAALKANAERWYDREIGDDEYVARQAALTAESCARGLDFREEVLYLLRGSRGQVATRVAEEG